MTEEFVLIGAGSAMFTRGLVADLVRTAMTAAVALVDVDPAALDVATKLSAKMIAAAPLTPGRRSIGVKRYPVQPPSSAPSASAGMGAGCVDCP